MTDGLVNLRTQFVTKFDILFCQPAGNAVGFEVGIELEDKRLVFGGVAQHAGVIVGGAWYWCWASPGVGQLADCESAAWEGVVTPGDCDAFFWDVAVGETVVI